ncbi:23S rRNA (guanosine(2251)-2'-O)-methyltransferase RlmB [Aliidiomarina quisquiliarum]|uniref:23S rRNA (guanosine(2251)-2'-O)-methyltransferase RlmB n=1 Tax=Aliidiomarina quisquiliarum TaxID=2938947 RepID=UPI00208E3561|nr:23S rRNA (guanosine(2251)-2'-O)-methyltransferase RlmB [Aliidiomarina quisquiliarum]MCO4321884.1 23S rRNA (guanosine(2251)-2'-O)-methyltransferase RlmB [Aliidiomarina quisquiliarum]
MSKKEEVFGIHSVQAILTHAPERVVELFIQQGKEDIDNGNFLKLAKQAGVRPQFCQRKVLDSRCGAENHQGVLAVVTVKPQLTENDLPDLIENSKTAPLFLILDQVTDPHNLGACLRTADAAGVTAVIVPKDKSSKLTSVVRKVASGAAEVVPFIVVTNLARCLRELQEQGIWVIGTAGEATESLYSTKLTGPIALVMGAEDTGIRRLTRDICDELIAIPLQGTVSSLNVSVASGVCLFEAVRQRS